MEKRWSHRGGEPSQVSLYEIENEDADPILLPDNLRPVPRPVTAIIIGAGKRGKIYGNYAIRFPDQLKIVGVAEPNAIRRLRFAQQHQLDFSACFTDWKEVFSLAKIADAVIISNPDHLHYGPCIAAMEAGYHILLEKPISPSESECRDILARSRHFKGILAVCHVLRYAPYFQQLKSLLAADAIGRVVSIQHLEPIEYVHMSHSYVRGNWHNSERSAPIILAKSSHDMDILRWLIGKPSLAIHAFGHLSWFRKENAPAGSTSRCTDGCAVEKNCPYSAIQIYYRDRKRNYVFDLPQLKEEQPAFILEQLKTTDYGRCVYRMDNDQPDHYVSNILFEDNTTVSFSMQAFTSYEGRRTRIMGSHGDIVGDMTEFNITHYKSNKKEHWIEKTDKHGGGDWRLMADFIQAVSKNDPGLLTSTIDASIESHLMGFAAELSRLEKRVVDIRL
ncbi:Gfo/Idh/MocA family protein [Flavihumibacter petaseus]|uniref:Putative oxidoreductase n=1 Tax=Flavihumibacter petaseus NBRC 106054 TaxID=1220578 RepID=A0A0E9MX79_9BACT|nr:Gfo/Idh/MocA family oxidoreductase [Flavihumibacter petaseus]GAO42108.1 putative oxidoreductase [Flavihumibacter petaseus NBRC 106054]